MSLEPVPQGLLHRLQFAGEEMIGAGDQHQFGWGRRGGHGRFQFRLGSELIGGAADKELGLPAAARKP